MTSAQREFLVQRLMEDSQKMRNSSSTLQKPPVNSSDSDEQMSDSSSDPGCALSLVVDSEKAVAPSRDIDKDSPMISNSLFANPLQYAATLASLAQMNFFQPGASTLPLLYPNLYQRLLTNPDNLDRLRYNFGQLPMQLPSEILANLASHQKTPNKSTEKKLLSSISLTSSKPQQSTPSPRKRSSTAAKNVDPNKHVVGQISSDDHRSPKKARAIRKIQFDDEKSSPVSGMYIKDATEVSFVDKSHKNGGGEEQLLHESADFVKITVEAELELSKIPNVIGDFICQLCKLKYDDAFRLAMHKCPRIGHKVYKCPECEKPFNCPANLASHRRWHRPKEEKILTSKRPVTPTSSESTTPITPEDPDGPVDLTSKIPIHNGDYEFIVNSANGVTTYYQCEFCMKKFDSHRLLRSHAISHTNFARDYQEAETQCSEPECELWFLTPESCEKHVRHCHPKYLCKFCMETFPTSPALTRHINKRHPSNDCRIIIFDESPNQD